MRDAPLTRDAPRHRPSLLRHAPAGALVAALCVAGLWREPWLDEAATLRIVTSADWIGWVRALLADQQPPLYPLLLTLWAAISTSVPWLRVFSVLCSMITVLLTVRWSISISPRAGVPAAALLAGSPFFLRYALELRPYALLATAAAGALLAAHRWATEPAMPRRVRLVLAAMLVLACTAHFTGILLVPATLALIAATPRDAGARRWPWAEYAVTVAAWAAMLAVQRQTLPRLTDGWWMPTLSGQLALRTFAEMTGLGAPGDVADAGTLAVLCALAVVAAVLCARAPARNWAPPLAAALAYGAAIALVSVAWRPVWWPRTLLPAIVPGAVALAAAAASQPTRSGRVAASTLLVMLAAAGGLRWTMRDATAPIEPWRAAAAGLLPDVMVPTVCVPDYAAWPLALAFPDGQARALVPLRLGTTVAALDAALVPAVDRLGAGGSVNLVVRVDLSLQRNLGAIDALAGALASARSSRRVGSERATSRGAIYVALVSSPDVSLVPSLADTVRDVEAALTTRLGTVAGRTTARGITHLVY